MTVWGEIAYRVRRAIAFHERFTVAQLVDTTGFTYEQVEQVVQRLLKDGYVCQLDPSELLEVEQRTVRRIGRPRQRYTLTDDPMKREEFYAAIEALAAGERLAQAAERRPDTPYFDRATQMITGVERGAERYSPERVNEAASLLAFGREAETLIPEGAEVAQAYYDVAQARLEALRAQYAEADRLLTQARETFEAAGLANEVQRVEELRLSFSLSQWLVALRAAIEQGSSPKRALDSLRHLIQHADVTGHLIQPLRGAVELLDLMWRRGFLAGLRRGSAMLEREAQMLEPQYPQRLLLPGGEPLKVPYRLLERGEAQPSEILLYQAAHDEHTTREDE